MVLDRELAFFERQRGELLEHHRGQFAVIKGEHLLGAYTTFEEAFGAGVHELGNQPFLVKMVEEGDGIVQYPALAVGMLNARLSPRRV